MANAVLHGTIDVHAFSRANPSGLLVLLLPLSHFFCGFLN